MALDDFEFFGEVRYTELLRVELAFKLYGPRGDYNDDLIDNYEK